MQHVDESWRWHTASAVPLRDEAGKIDGFEGVARDITELKRAEDELKKRNSFVESLLENAPIGFAVNTIDDGQAVYVSRNFEMIYGVPYGSLQSVSDYFEKVYLDPAFRETMRERIMEDMATGDAAKMRWEDIPITTASGQRKAVTAINIPLPEQNLMISTVLDVTERKRTEEALQESKLIIDGIINTIPVRVFWKDTNLVYLGCNDAYAHDAGFNGPKEVIGKDDFEMGWRDKAEVYRAEDRQVIETGSPILNVEESQMAPDGSTFTLLGSKVPLRTPGGEVAGVLGTYMDITERKKTEEALARERNLLRTLMDNLPDYVYIKDAETRYVLNNPGHLRSLGVTKQQDVLGKNSFDFFPQPLAAQYQADEREVIRSGQPLVEREEMVVDLATDQPAWHLTTKVPLWDSQGKVVGLVGVSRDITERKETEEALREERGASEGHHLQHGRLGLGGGRKRRLHLQLGEGLRLLRSSPREHHREDAV